jgi:hypothetical protein
VAALTGILAVALLAIGFYNWRVTGDPLRLPHQPEHEQYSVFPNFFFEKPQPEPHYNHAAIRDFYAHREGAFQEIPESAWDFVTYLLSREQTSFWFFLGPVLLLPLLLYGPKALMSRKLAILTVSLLLTIAGLSLLVWLLQRTTTLRPAARSCLADPVHAKSTALRCSGKTRRAISDQDDSIHLCGHDGGPNIRRKLGNRLDQLPAQLG